VAATNRSIPVVIPIGEPKKEDIHAVAERFLRDHLAKTGSKCEAVRAVIPRTVCAVESRGAAEGFLRHLATKQVEAKRYEIEEPEHVILSRSTTRVAPYFYGFKNGFPVFTHDSRLAQIVDSKDAKELQGALRDRGIDVTMLPVPETHVGSL
jgi:hypothetical protein